MAGCQLLVTQVIRELLTIGRMTYGAHHSAVPTPVIDPRLINASGCPPSAFRLLPCGEPPGACSPTLNRDGLPILRHWIKIGKASTCSAGTLHMHCTPGISRAKR